MEIQSIIIPRNKYTEKEAVEFIKKHKFKVNFYRKKYEIKKNYFRFRQKAPHHFNQKSYRLKTLSNGIKFVLGRTK